MKRFSAKITSVIGVFLTALALCGVYIFGGTSVQPLPPQISLTPGDLPKVGESVTKDGYTITNEGVAPVPVHTPKLPRVATHPPSRPQNITPEQYSLVVAKLTPLQEKVTAYTQALRASHQGVQTPLPTNELLDIALYHTTLGDPAGAEAIWTYLIAASPSLVQPYGNLGSLYMSQKRYTEAQEKYTKAIELAPKVAQYYHDLADIYVAQGALSNAYAVLEKGAAADTTNWSHLVVLGRFYNQAGKLKEAHAAFNEAIARAQKAGNKDAAAIEQEKIYTQ